MARAAEDVKYRAAVAGTALMAKYGGMVNSSLKLNPLNVR